MESALKRADIRETPLHKIPLQFNERNLVKMIDLPNTLSGAEKEKMADRIKQEKEKY